MEEESGVCLRGNLFVAIVFGFAVMSVGFESGKYVVIDFPSSSVTVENGKPFQFALRLRPAAGIHINSEPRISAESQSAGVSITVASLHTAGDMLDASQPVVLECKTEGLTPGMHDAVFVLRYTYCSDRDKWCRMATDTVRVELKVIR